MNRKLAMWNLFMAFTLTMALILIVTISEQKLSNQKEIITQLELAIMELRKENADIEKKIEKLKIIPAVITAYAPNDNQSGICADSNPSKTSTGQTPSRGIVAVDPSRIPYGTKLNIPGYGMVEAGDTGGALRADKDNVRIDVYMESFQEAMSFGKQDIEVIILE